MFAVGEAGGRGAEGEVSPVSPSKGMWQVTLGGHELSATAITLKRLFLPDQILWHERRPLVGATFN